MSDPSDLSDTSDATTEKRIMCSVLVWVVMAAANGIVIPAQTGVAAGAWHFSNGAEFPGASGALTADAKNVLHLRYDFTKGGAYVAACCDFDSPAALKSLRFRARKTPGATITVRVTDSADQTFQKSMTYPDRDWQPVVCTMQGWTGSWGGPKDGIVRPPFKSACILVESQGLERSKGEVLIADVAGESGTANETPVPSGEGFNGSYVASTFDDDSVFGCSGPCSLKGNVWSADLGKASSVALHHSLSFFGKPSEFTLKVGGGHSGQILKMEIGSHFHSYTRVLGTLDGSEQTFTVPAPPEGWTQSGAKEPINYPIRLSSLILERGDAPPEPVQVILHSLRCKTSVPPANMITMVSSLKESGCTADTRTLAVTCTAWNLLDVDACGTLDMTVRDWEENVIAHEEVGLTLPKDGVRASCSLEAKIPAGLNYADVALSFGGESQGLPEAHTRTSYTRGMNDAGDPALHPESPWGMGVYLYRYGTVAEMDRIASLAQAAGVKWSREEFSWQRMQPQRGAVDFTFYDTVVGTALQHGISVYGLLSYWTSWTKPYTEEGIDDFCAWAGEVVKHFKDRVKYWEIYNEPNIFFWEGPKELYPVLVKKCYAAIKATDPEATVLAVSTAGIDRKFIQRVVDAGAPFDVLTVHPYRARINEKGFMRELNDASKQVGGRPVWITEMGWSTQVGGADERKQAQYLARCYLAAIASGACHNMGWYDFRDDGTDPFYFESNFGVLRHSLTPKPAYRALATVCRTLASGDARVPKRLPEGVCALEKGGAVSLWAPESDVTVACRVKGETLRVENLMGEPLKVERSKDNVELKLRPGSPVFLSGASIKILNKHNVPATKRGRDPITF